MKSKMKIITLAAVVAIAAAVVAFVLIWGRGSKAAVFLNGEKLAIEAKREEDSAYIPAEDFLELINMEYEKAEHAIRIQDGRNVEIDGKSGKVLIDGEARSENIKVKKDKLMIPVGLAGEIVGGEVNVMDDGIYIVKTEPVTVRFRENNKDIRFGYSDGLFTASAFGYNHALAKMSLGAAVAAFSAKEADEHWGEDEECQREANIVGLFGEMGFGNIKAYNYDKSLNDPSDKVAFAIGEKSINAGGKKYRLIAVAIRGGAYGNEWVSNFNVGIGEDHAGFSAAAEEVVRGILSYAGEDLKNVKLWITGYSRGAAVANLAAAKLEGAKGADTKNIYAYTFATPRGTKNKDSHDEKYGYIFNIINSNDLVPLVAPEQWGYERYGKDVSFPPFSAYDSKAAEAEAEKIDKIYSEINSGGGLDLMAVEDSNQAEQVRNVINSICTAVKSAEDYNENYQTIMMDFIKCGNTKVKDKNGKWKWVTADEGIKNIYKEEGAAILKEAESDTFLKTVKDRFGSAGRQILAFGALCIKNGKEAHRVISEEIGISNLITIASVFVPTGETGTIARAHYPETYIALMQGISDPQMLIIE